MGGGLDAGDEAGLGAKQPRGPIAMKIKGEKVLAYGDPKDTYWGHAELKKIGPGEWAGSKQETRHSTSYLIKLTKEGVELTRKPEYGSWEQKTFFDAEGKPKRMELSSPLFEKSLKADIAEETAVLKPILSALKNLGIKPENLERCSIQDKETGNVIDFRPYGKEDKIVIQTKIGETRPKGDEVHKTQSDILMERQYEMDFSLHSVYFFTNAFKENSDKLYIAREATDMAKFLSIPEVKMEAERLRKLLSRDIISRGDEPM